MNLLIIYDEVLNLYPKNIDVSDGKFFEENEGFYSAHLTHAFDIADTQALKMSEWHSLLTWVIYQALHERAKDASAKGEGTITHERMKDEVRPLLLHNLEQEDFEDMKKQFIKHETLRGVFSDIAQQH